MLAHRPTLPVGIATAVALVPALGWAGSAGPELFTWRGFASLTGFAAAGLFAVSMVLVLRVPWLDRAFRGLVHVQWTHHVLGTAAFALLLLHPLALGLATLQTSPLTSLRLLWPPSSGVVLLGWTALLLFAAFFVVSVRPRLPFDRWLRVHQASGLAYAAMAGHLVAAWTGSLAAGLALGLVGAGALGFAYRLLALDAPSAGLRFRVTEVHHRGPNVVDLVLDPLERPLRFDPGQFVYVSVVASPGYRPCGELHPYTLTGRPDEPRLRLSIKALGDCTRHVQEVVPGAEVRVQGPFGDLFPAGSRRPQVWIAGGMGITPFRSRLSTLGPEDPPVDLLYAAPTAEGALYLDELHEVAARRPNVHLHTMFEDSSGRPTAAAIQSRVGALDEREFVLAGPPAMVRALKRELTDVGVPASRVHSEEGLSMSRTRNFVYACVLAFAVGSAALVMLALRARAALEPGPELAAGPGDTLPAGPNDERPAPLRTFSADEVARHDQPDDCWLVIRGRVYDVSTYIGSHPSAPQTITDHCGEESTVAFETKDRGRPHSPQAWQALEDYLVGQLAAPGR